VGAAAATVVSASSALGSNPTGAFTGLLSTPLADLTLLAIALGAVSANVLNIYSGAMSFVAVGIRLPLSLRRAIVALGFGAIGFFLAWSAARGGFRGPPQGRVTRHPGVAGSMCRSCLAPAGGSRAGRT
jgi:purine-cytosine permease-like protein